MIQYFHFVQFFLAKWPQMKMISEMDMVLFSLRKKTEKKTPLKIWMVCWWIINRSILVYLFDLRKEIWDSNHGPFICTFQILLDMLEYWQILLHLESSWPTGISEMHSIILSLSMMNWMDILCVCWIKCLFLELWQRGLQKTHQIAWSKFLW